MVRVLAEQHVLVFVPACLATSTRRMSGLEAGVLAVQHDTKWNRRSRAVFWTLAPGNRGQFISGATRFSPLHASHCTWDAGIVPILTISGTTRQLREGPCQWGSYARQASRRLVGTISATTRFGVLMRVASRRKKATRGWPCLNAAVRPQFAFCSLKAFLINSSISVTFSGARPVNDRSSWPRCGKTFKVPVMPP